MNNRLFRDRLDIIVLVILLFGFLLLFALVPIQEYGDSLQYIHHMVSRDPVYPLLIQLFTTVFGNYGVSLCFFQNLLAVICIYYTYNRLSRVFDFGGILRILTILLLLIPHLITPLASRTHMVITCSVLTEGITFSLYYVWITMMISILVDHYNGNHIPQLILSLVLSVVLSMTRGQFVLCILIWLGVAIYDACANKKVKLCIIYLVVVVAALVGKKELTHTYNRIENGVYTDTVSSAPMLLANLVYICNEEDYNLIDDTYLRNAFINMCELAGDAQLSEQYATGNVIERAKFHELGHETINFDYVTEQIDDLIYVREGIDEEDYNLFMCVREEYANQLIKMLLPHKFTEFMCNTLIVASLGFIRSISIDRGIFIIWSVLMYILAFGVMIKLMINNRSDRKALPILLVLLSVCGTVFGTSLMIECISRYMIYNFPFFYIVLIAGMGNLLKLRKSDKNSDVQ